MPVLLDSSIYIAAMRTGKNSDLVLQRWVGESPVWLSSVVMEELYAGASLGALPLLEKLERDFDRVGRVLTPNSGDWVKTGRLIAQLGQKYGYEQIGKAYLTNDALISTSAARRGITVITANQRDFARLAEFCPVQWQVNIYPEA